MKTSTMFFVTVIICLIITCGVLLVSGGKNDAPAPAVEPAAVDTPAIPSTPAVANASSGLDFLNPGAPAYTPSAFKTVQPGFGTPWSYAGMKDGTLPNVSTNNCKSGILVDLTNRKVLWGKNCKLPGHIASMTKMLTVLLVMEALEEQKLTLSTVIPVSRSAAAIGGSQANIDPRESFSVDSLLEAVMVHSANDCAQLLAEHLGGGTRDAFIARMNARAKELGMRGAKFYNPHGLPAGSTPKPGDGDNLASPADMALLAEYLLQYPKVMTFAKQMNMSFASPLRPVPSQYVNSNHRILRNVPGTDGLKTGLSNKAGQCVTVTCLRNGRRMVAVVTGVPQRDARTKLIGELFNWGYAQP